MSNLIEEAEKLARKLHNSSGKSHNSSAAAVMIDRLVDLLPSADHLRQASQMIDSLVAQRDELLAEVERLKAVDGQTIPHQVDRAEKPDARDPKWYHRAVSRLVAKGNELEARAEKAEQLARELLAALLAVQVAYANVMVVWDLASEEPSGSVAMDERIEEAEAAYYATLDAIDDDLIRRATETLGEPT